MRILFGLLLVCCFGTSPAQRILYTSQDMNRTDTTSAIRAIRPHWLAGSLAANLTVVYKSGLKQQVRRDSIWGFEADDHSVYRSYQGDLYKISHADDLLMYTNTTSRYPLIRYSKTFDSPLYGTRRKTRRDTVSHQ